MLVNYSLDWQIVGAELRQSMQTAPATCRKDLARMIGHIEGLVQKLGSEEVELRRTKKTSSIKSQELLAAINESINEFEKWLMLAHLQHG